MHDMFEKFGTALYLRRGMQKRAYYGKKAVDYLEKVGALDSEAQPQQYTPLQAAGTAAAGIGAGLAGTGALYGAGQGLLALRRRGIDRTYHKAVGKRLLESPNFFPGETAQAYRRRVMNSAGDGMANKMHQVDKYRNFAKSDKLRKLRNPLLMGGALAGSALASKLIYDKAKASAQAQGQ